MSKKKNSLTEVRKQYEEFPYPSREPEDEKERLLIPVLSRMDIVCHHGFNGKQDFNNFNVLIAGAGTGDSAIFWAEQLRERENCRVVYLDMSKSSKAIAQERANIRKLDNIQWVTGSLLDAKDLDIGEFDFIECSGVLHHLEDPDAGLTALKQVLKPEGILSIMVYAAYGRTAIYHMQELMRWVNHSETDPHKKVENTKKIINQLPPQHWLLVGQQHVMPFSDLAKDTGIYDLLLHSQDRAYKIHEAYEWLERCDMQMTSPPGIGTSEYITYLPETFIKDAELLKQIKQLPKRLQESIAENMFARNIKHNFYSTHSGRPPTVANPRNLELIPFAGLVGATPLDQLAKAIAGSPDSHINVTSDKYNGKTVTQLYAHKHTADIISLIDGKRTGEEIFNALCQLPKHENEEVYREQFVDQYDEVIKALNQGNFVFLRHKSVPAFSHLSRFEKRVTKMY